MLSTGNGYTFYYLRNFHDMRCKYDRIRSIIREELHRDPCEGEMFLMMSKNRRMVRLFEYDLKSCSMHEKRFRPDYRFMKVVCEGGQTVYRISWDDVRLLLKSPVVKTLEIN